MAYSITTNDNQTITVTDELLNTDSSQILIGRNAINYGQSIVTNTIRQLESFAGSNIPSGINITGQLWYNKNENTLRVYNGSTWARTSLVPSGTANDQAELTDLVKGTGFFNTTEDKLKIYDGAVFRDAVLPGGTVTSAFSAAESGTATNYGAKVETLFLQAQGASPSVVPVMALKYVSDGTVPGELADSAHDSAGATVMAIFSDKAFTVDSSDPYYPTLSNTLSFSGTITKGMNLRADYTDSSIANSYRSTFATQADALYVGGSPIPAADYIHVGSVNWVPSGVSSVLGTSSNKFADLHVGQMQIGHVGTPKSIGILGDVTLGNVTNEVKEIFVHDLHVSGDLDFALVNNLTGLEDANISNVVLTRGTITETASSALDIVNLTTLTAATTSASLVAGATIVDTPVDPTDTHSVFLGQGTTGNISTSSHSGITYLPSTSTLTTGTVSATTLTDGSFSVSAGAITGASTGTFSGTVTGGSLTDGTATLSSGALSGATTGSFSGTMTAGNFTTAGIITDGVASLSDGAITGATTGSFSGAVTGGSLTDGTATLSSGALSGVTTLNLTSTITGATAVTASGAVTGGTLTDGTASIASGAITGATTGNFSGTVTANLFSGTATQARYADLAEKYTSDAEYEAGTVVKIGGDAEITMTTEHADSEVFGVISTDPAYLMNKDIDGLPVALQGRVPVKVIGKVKKGQRLTSSDVPGLAWAADESTPIQAIIGRSLENKTDGNEGVVEAVIGVK